ncbi:MAG: hypothetical protein JWM82_1471 [Myxococcales bacterium]|nr:hypothetical protein [Myxococcales bacterium]
MVGEAASSGADLTIHGLGDLTIHGLIDRLAERFSSGPHKLAAMRAREEYFERAGKVFDDDAELFEGRMAAFLEWYVLDRPMPTTSGDTAAVAPVVSVLADPSWSPAERRGLAHLATSHRGLFELYAVADRVLDVEDLIGGARFQVVERRKTLGFSAGDIFEARVLWDGSAPVFGRTFLFHPPDARDVVLDWVERAVERGVSRDDILFHLSRNHIRWHRLGHLGAAKIYRGDG